MTTTKRLPAAMPKGFDAVPKGTLFLSPYNWETHDEGEIRRAWDQGKQFKMWMGPPCTVRDLLRIKMSGWTFIFLIFERGEDGRVTAHAIDLAMYDPPALPEGD